LQTAKQVMHRVGHTTTVTAVPYQHVLADSDAAIARELDRLIERGAPPGDSSSAGLGAWPPFWMAPVGARWDRSSGGDLRL
jgi:hypothetical protein